jgi:hypothetical protein
MGKQQFTVGKRIDDIRQYFAFLSGYHFRPDVRLAVFKGSQSPTVRVSDAVMEEFPQVRLQTLFSACVKSE